MWRQEKEEQDKAYQQSLMADELKDMQKAKKVEVGKV